MSLALLAAVPLLVLDLTAGDGGLVASGDVGQWEWGRVDDGPVSAPRAWGTRLGAVYRHNDVSYLEVPLPSLADATLPVLELAHWWSVTDGERAVVEVNEGLAWVRMEPAFGYPHPDGFIGRSGGWQFDTFDLSSHDPGSRVRLAFETDAAGAAEGWFVRGLTVWDGDVTPPRITPVTEPGDTQEVFAPYRVEVEVDDDLQVDGVSLFWSTDGPVEAVAMSPGALWSADIPGAAPDTVVSWWVEATDGENVARYPDDSDAQFRVFLAAPGPPVRNDASRVGQSVSLRWSAPISPHPVIDYEVRQEGARSGVSTGVREATLSLDPALPSAAFVTARYEAGEGDRSATTPLDIAVPQLISVTPAVGFPGEVVRLDVAVLGQYLLDGQTTAALGDGIDVEAVHVFDVGHVRLTVAIDPKAPPGGRSVSIDGPQGSAVYADAFTVGDAADAPRIVSVRPGTLTQGRPAEITIRASLPFAGEVTVDPGEHIQVTTAPVTDGDEVVIGLTPTTRAPLGPTTLILDDGLRLWSAEVEVEDYVVPLQRSCAHAPHGGSWVAWLGVLLGWRRRREH
ncbi:MAG: hypothetical protein ACI8PZ_000260 [Myxococcota bacterium]|jgi:hypothetical protein